MVPERQEVCSLRERGTWVLSLLVLWEGSLHTDVIYVNIFSRVVGKGHMEEWLVKGLRRNFLSVSKFHLGVSNCRSRRFWVYEGGQAGHSKYEALGCLKRWAAHWPEALRTCYRQTGASTGLNWTPCPNTFSYSSGSTEKQNPGSWRQREELRWAEAQPQLLSNSSSNLHTPEILQVSYIWFLLSAHQAALLCL